MIKEEYKIIDSHSHIGLGFNNRESSINDYNSFRKKHNIVFGLLMPQPVMDDKIERNKELFDNMNNIVWLEIKNNFYCDELFFVPMISPVYMNYNDIEKYVVKYNPIAFKIHCRSDDTYPEMINNDIINVIKKYNIPLIVHTDYSRFNKSKKDIIKNLNSSLKWFEFFDKYNLKGYLTHGARLSPKVLEEVNYQENIVLGIGPDLMLQDYSDSSLEQNGNYLKIIKEHVNPKKIIFDVDYNWNIDIGMNIDQLFLERLKVYWSEEDLKRILYENSNNFFEVEKIKKYRRGARK